MDKGLNPAAPIFSPSIGRGMKGASQQHCHDDALQSICGSFGTYNNSTMPMLPHYYHQQWAEYHHQWYLYPPFWQQAGQGSQSSPRNDHGISDKPPESPKQAILSRPEKNKEHLEEQPSITKLKQQHTLKDLKHGSASASNEQYPQKETQARHPTISKVKTKAGSDTTGGLPPQEAPAHSYRLPIRLSTRGTHHQPKINMPAPLPTKEYIEQAARNVEKPGHAQPILVILDLNGTVLYRPSRNPKRMIKRPHLKQFLRYLFQHFKVMIWSSARPDNVKSLVDQAIEPELQELLVARWARDSFKLPTWAYNENVQVYKNLDLVWAKDEIQQCHPHQSQGVRFGQQNTVLIDDSIIKAAAQPHNLINVSDFKATPEQMEVDFLSEVAGYLEILMQQSDVSQFVHKQPFREGGIWKYQWPAE